MKLYTIIITCVFTIISSSIARENQFITGGVPATDREWNGADYIATFKAIQSGKVPLPLLKDKLGKQVIDRMTNLENFSFNRNKKLPLDPRFPDYLQIQDSNNAILKVYVAEANKGAKLNAEIAKIAGYNLHIAALGIDLLNEFIPTIPRDETYEVRMQGIKKMYAGLTTQFVGMEISLSETKFYSESDISSILHAMHETLPKIKQAFSAEYKEELKLKLVERRKQFEGDDLKALEQMISELKKANKSQ